MLGFRGAARYISDEFSEAFAMECEALRRVRNDMGLTNVQVMVPFVRTLGQAERVTQLLAEHGLKRGEDDLKVIMMCEVPSNAILAEEFLEYFDGFSIGSNDLTQLTLGLDRDSGLELLAADFDERDPAVKAMLSPRHRGLHGAGQVRRHLRPGPQRPPGLRAVAGRRGHRSISLNPDSVIATWQQLAGGAERGSDARSAAGMTLCEPSALRGGLRCDDARRPLRADLQSATGPGYWMARRARADYACATTSAAAAPTHRSDAMLTCVAAYVR